MSVRVSGGTGAGCHGAHLSTTPASASIDTMATTHGVPLGVAGVPVEPEDPRG